MNTKRIQVGLSALLLAVGLAACGGSGDDEAGSNTQFSIVPDNMTLTGPPGACGVGGDTLVLVSGGVAPYRIVNLVPAYVTVNKTEVANRDETFMVSFLGGCLDPGQVVVIDSLNRQVVLTLTNKEGEAATP